MNSKSKFIRLLEELKKATSLGEVKWRETIDENIYRVLLDGAIVRIGREVDEKDGNVHYTAKLIDEKRDEPALVLSDVDDERCQVLLPELFELARERAGDVDELLDQLISNLASRRRQWVKDKR